MKLINKTGQPYLNEAIRIANEILEDDLKSIIVNDNYTYTDDAYLDILNKFIYSYKIINVKLYFPRYRSKALGYWDGKDIYLNGYRTNRSTASLVGSFIHEAAHAAEYRHGSNSVRWYNRKKKYASVPYATGIQAKRVVENGEH